MKAIRTKLCQPKNILRPIKVTDTEKLLKNILVEEVKKNIFIMKTKMKNYISNENSVSIIYYHRLFAGKVLMTDKILSGATYLHQQVSKKIFFPPLLFRYWTKKFSPFVN